MDDHINALLEAQQQKLYEALIASQLPPGVDLVMIAAQIRLALGKEQTEALADLLK